MTKKNILVLPAHDAALMEYIRLFEELSDLYTPYFYIAYNSQFYKKIESHGWKVLSQFQEKKNTPAYKKYFTEKLKKLLDDTNIGCFIQRYVLLERLSKKLEVGILAKKMALIELMKVNQISGVILASDRSCGIEASAICAAKERELSIIIPSFAYSATYESSYKLRKKKIYDAKYSIHESNVMHCDILGDKSFFRPFESKALSNLNVMPKKPWLLGGGNSDFVLLESSREKERLLNYGAEPGKYVVTGTSTLDQLFYNLKNQESIKNAVFSEIEIKKYSKVIVFALPQYFEHGLMSKVDQTKCFEDLFKKLKLLNYTFLVSLHPKANRGDYEWINKISDNIRVSDRSISELVVLADLFVGTYTSTMAWALLCHKECVILDHADLNYSNFLTEFEIPVYANNSEFLNFLNEPSEWSNCNFNEVDKLGVLDGNSKDRIASLLKSL